MTLMTRETRKNLTKAAVALSCAASLVLLAVATGASAQTKPAAPAAAPAKAAPAAPAKPAAMAPDANGYIPQATIIEIMDSMVMSSAQTIWDAVSVDVTDKGTIEKTPQTDEEWAKLRWTAVTLAEATNALVIPGRRIAPPGTKSKDPTAELGPEDIEKLLAKNRGAWVAYAHVLHEAAMEALRAIDAKNIEAISDAGGTIDAACEGCHLQFWYPNQKQ